MEGLGLPRRRALALLAAAGLVAPSLAWTSTARGETCTSAELLDLARRLRPWLGLGEIAGLDATEAQWVLFPVTKERALPRDYTPADLVWTAAGGPAPQGRQPVR